MVLRGRAAEQQLLESALQTARDGSSRVLVLRGEPGIGKSALLDYAREQADGMTVLRCTGIEAEHEMPFAGIHQLIRPCLEHLDVLPEPQRMALNGALGLSSDAVDDRFLVSLGLLSVLAEASNDGPLLCLIDDAQWLDRPSQDALAFAARRLEAEPIALLLAAREGDPRRFESDGLDELRLGALPEAEARALLGDRLEREAPPVVLDTLVRNAGGNPLALLELPSGLSDGQLVGTEPIVGPPLARGAVEEQYRARVAALPPAARRMLLLAAADDVGDLGTISRAASGLGGVLEDLAPAEEAGLVRVEDPIAFRHPLVRSAAYRSAQRAERAEAHGALADAIDDPVRSAWHRAAITEGADESLAAELEEAGMQALARGAHASASAAFERAADLSPEPAAKGTRLVHAAQASFDSGRPDAALALVERARPLVEDPLERIRMDLIRSTDLVRRGAPHDAYAIQNGVIEELGPLHPDMAVELILWESVLGTMGGWPERAEGELPERLEAVGTETGAHAFARPFHAGTAALLARDFTAAREHYDQALEIGRDAPRESLAGFGVGAVFVLRGYIHFALGEFTEAREIFNDLMALNRAGGSLADTVGTLPLLAVTEAMERRTASAAALVEEGLELAEPLGYANDVTGLLGTRARIAALLGDEETARASAQEAVRRGVANGVGWAVTQARVALGELELGLGRYREAVEQFDQIEPTPFPPILLLSTPDLIEALLRLDEHDRASEALAALELWAPISRSPATQGSLARSRALLAEEPAEIEARFEEALSHHAQAPLYDRARTQLAYGEWLRRERRKTDARAQLRPALDSFEGIKAAPWAERARGELRATGETARKRDASTADDLTPQELRIAQLVAQGQTNRDVASQLFVSPKTVEYHLRKVFMKLGVGSRVELARLPLGEPDAAQAASAI
jgi:DNA-binding CsgD family transcriptional regulator